jgi:ribosomal protein L12E/L44/L45/RPP1/RPP2
MALASAGGGGSKTGDIRAGGAFVEISAKDNLSKSMARIQANVAGFAAGLRKIGTLGVGIGGAALAPLALLFKGGVDRAEEISKMAEALGFSVEQMQRLKYAADVAGVSIDDVLKNPGKFKDLMSEAPLMSPGEIRAAVVAQQEFRKSIINLQEAMVPLLNVVAPIVREISKFIKENKDVAIQIGMVAGAVGALGGGLVIVAPLIEGAAAAFAALLKMVGKFKLSTVGLFIAFGKEAKGVEGLVNSISDAFKNMGVTFGEVWGGIVEAVKKGEIQEAFKLAAAGIKVIWYQMLIDLGRAFAQFIDDNRTELVALGAIKGGAMGARLGRFAGPKGAIAGGVAGLFAGGFLADYALDEIKDKLGNMPEFEKKLAEARKEMNATRKRISDAKPLVDTDPAYKGGGETAALATMAKGAFRIADASQQFGGNQPEKKLVEIKGVLMEILEAINKQEKEKLK